MVTIGIQGGKGSYNEEACKYFCKIQGIKEYKIVYLFTSGRVMKSLHLGNIDYAQFAIEDPLGGIVDESINALTKYSCKIIDKFRYPVNHCLFIHKDSSLKKIKRIMTHPQIYKQCKNSLKAKYPAIPVRFGKGKLIDQSVVAQRIASGKIEKDTGVIGAKVLKSIYPELKLIFEGLQDVKDSYTTYIFCKRRYIV